MRNLLAVILLTISSLPLLASQQAIITWKSNPQPGIAGYRIYFGPAPGNYTNMLEVGNVTNVVIRELVEGANYYFAATSYNVLGMESGFSTEVAVVVPSGCTLAIINLFTNGVSTAVVTGCGAVPERWALEASPDLASWATITRGTNSPVNVSVPTAGASQQFFRLRSE